MCSQRGMAEKWNKSQMLFPTPFLKFFSLLHSTLLPLSSFLDLIFTSLYFFVLFLSSYLCLILIPTLVPSSTSSFFSLTLCSSPSLLLSYFFFPLQNALWCWRLLAIFTKNKVIRHCWKQEKKYSLVPVIENRIIASPISHSLLSNF